MADNGVKSPFNLWWAGAGIFLILVLVAAVFVGVGLGKRQSAQQSEAGGQAAPQNGGGDAPNSSGGAPGGDSGGRCDLEPGDQSYPQTAPKTTWELYKEKAPLPTSETFGPTKRDGDFWRCYAHSPTGAVFAGVGLMTDFSVGLIKESATPSEQREEIFKSQQRANKNFHHPDFTGFRVLEYSDSTAQLSYRARQGSLIFSIDLTVVWDPEANDWRLALDKQEPLVQKLSDLESSGYIDWTPDGR